jgi:hypothetical protein
MLTKLNEMIWRARLTVENNTKVFVFGGFLLFGTGMMLIYASFK